VRSGFKTSNNLFTDQPLPGIFHNLVGTTVSDWHSLPPGVSYDLNSSIPGLVGPSTLWAEALRPTISDSQSNDSDLQLLAQYNSGPFNTNAALTEHKIGAGRVLYLGWYPTGPQAAALLSYLTTQVGLLPLADLPDGLIASQRGLHLILLNFTEETLTATVQGQAVSVAPRDVEVVTTDGS
jgi:hypothetical protein